MHLNIKNHSTVQTRSRTIQEWKVSTRELQICLAMHLYCQCYLVPGHLPQRDHLVKELAVLVRRNHLAKDWRKKHRPPLLLLKDHCLHHLLVDTKLKRLLREFPMARIYMWVHYPRSRIETTAPLLSDKCFGITQQIGAEIGRGAFAVVYQAFNVETGDFVAVKRFPLAAIDDESLSSIQVRLDIFITFQLNLRDISTKVLTFLPSILLERNWIDAETEPSQHCQIHRHDQDRKISLYSHRVSCM